MQVRLIGYYVEGSLFLVYEYIDNGNLSQHLRGSGKVTAPFSAQCLCIYTCTVLISNPFSLFSRQGPIAMVN